MEYYGIVLLQIQGALSCGGGVTKVQWTCRLAIEAACLRSKPLAGLPNPWPLSDQELLIASPLSSAAARDANPEDLKCMLVKIVLS